METPEAAAPDASAAQRGDSAPVETDVRYVGRKPSGRLKFREFGKRDGFSGGPIATGIMLAGAAYPIVVGLIVGIATAPDWIGELHAERLSGILLAIIEWPLMLLFFAAGASTVGMCLAGLVSAYVLSVVWLVVTSMKLRIRPVWVGAFAGGLVGFLCLLVPFGVLYTVWNWPATSLELVLLGPVLATVFGQIGGAWGGYRPEDAWERNLKPATPPANDIRPEAPATPRFQFQIRHLLWLSFWLSVLLATIRLTGLPMGSIIGLLAAWTVSQAVTLMIGNFICSRFGPRYLAWRATRRARRLT